MDEQYFQYDNRSYQTPTCLKNNKNICLNNGGDKTVTKNNSRPGPYSRDYGSREALRCHGKKCLWNEHFFHTTIEIKLCK